MSNAPALAGQIAYLEGVIPELPLASHILNNTLEWAKSGVVIPQEDWTRHVDGSGFWMPQCRATTVKGKPCKNHIFEDQRYRFDDNDQPYLSAEEWAQYQRGHCDTHERVSVNRKA